MGEVRRTLIPQYSIRRVLAITMVMAVVSLVVSLAVRGHAWAGGITVGLVAVVIAFAVYAVMFAIVSLFAGLWQKRGGARAQSENRESSVAASSARVAKLVWIGFVLCLPALCSSAAWAASGGSITLPLQAPNPAVGPQPTQPPPNPTGLTLTVDTTWVDSSGYRPVRVDLKSVTGPVTADRVLTLRFRPQVGTTRRDSVVVTQTLEIPAGDTAARATISVPQFGPWGMIEWDVYEDGKPVKELSIDTRSAWASWSGTSKGDGGLPVTLVFADANQIVEPQLSGTNERYYVGLTTNAQIIAKYGLNPNASPGVSGPLPTMADLPVRWIDYTGFDLATISRDDLRTLVTKHSDQWKAIGKWLNSGGTLIVYGAGNRWQHISDIERLVGLPDDQQSDPTTRGWILPRKNDNRPLGAAPAAVDATADALAADESVDEALRSLLTGSADSKPTDSVSLDDAQFLTRRCGLGLVGVIRSDDSFTGTGFSWDWLLNTIGPERLQWHLRNGVSMYQPNDDFWNFLIPGVGLPPVIPFQVLISLFVIVIGPLNYYLLRRWGKLNLTVLTVPAGALLITGALLLSALVADGLGVRVRARSFTHIDQRTGEAACWTRLSYYAGMAPSGGLTFSSDTSVLPLEQQPDFLEEGPVRTVDWERLDPSNPNSALEQQLPDGWLRSRTPTQYITARIRKTAARLEIEPGGADGPMKVVNRLGTKIRWLLMVDDDGSCYIAEGVGNGEPAALRKVESQRTAFLAELQPILVENLPQRPEAMVGSGGRGFFGLNRGRNPYFTRRNVPQVTNSIKTIVAPPSQNTSVLERSLNETSEQMIRDRLPPRTYVAIVESSPEVELGTPSAREDASLHQVVGRW